MADGTPDGEFAFGELGLMFGFEDGGDVFALFGGEPAGVARVIGEVEEGGDSQEDGGEAFEDEEPVPAGVAEPVDFQERGGDGRADDLGDRHGGHEQGDGFGAAFGGIPVAEVDDQPWEEGRFGGAQEEARQVEFMGVLDEAAEGGDDSPGDDQAGDDFSR